MAKSKEYKRPKRVPESRMLKPNELSVSKYFFPLLNFSLYESLIILHGDVIEIMEETESAIYLTVQLRLDGKDYQKTTWLPKSIFEIKRKGERND